MPAARYVVASAAGGLFVALLLFAVVDAFGLRLVLMLVAVPVGTVAGIACYRTVKRAVLASIRSGKRRADGQRSLADCVRNEVPAVVRGRLKCAKLVVAPRTKQHCAAYVVRKPGGVGHVDVVSGTGLLEIETDRDGILELETGAWAVDDPFDGVARAAEARLDDGAEVSVTARVEVHAGEGAGYRDEGVRYALAAEGGSIAPLARYSAISIERRDPWFRWPFAISAGIGAIGCVMVLVKGPPPRPLQVASTNGVASTPTASVAPASAATCGLASRCAAGQLCDGETGRCVEKLAGSLHDGDACKHAGDCGAGLRCEVDVLNSAVPMARKCAVPCHTDEDCPAGRWCMPCSDKVVSNDAFCVAPESIPGAVGELCKIQHELAARKATTSRPDGSATAAPSTDRPF